jgi:hypothetical protein
MSVPAGAAGGSADVKLGMRRVEGRKRIEGSRYRNLNLVSTLSLSNLSRLLVPSSISTLPVLFMNVPSVAGRMADHEH